MATLSEEEARRMSPEERAALPYIEIAGLAKGGEGQKRQQHHVCLCVQACMHEQMCTGVILGAHRSQKAWLAQYGLS